MERMDAKARQALRIIRGCVAAGRYRVLPHFVQRMHERGFFWLDVLALLDTAREVRGDGQDRFGRAKWLIGGKSADGVELTIVAVLDAEVFGRTTVFITIY